MKRPLSVAITSEAVPSGFSLASTVMAPVQMVTKALLRTLDRDKAELVVMPGPGSLMRALMDYFPGMGPWMNQQLGVNKTLREVQAFKRSQTLERPDALRARLDVGADHVELHLISPV